MRRPLGLIAVFLVAFSLATALSGTAYGYYSTSTVWWYHDQANCGSGSGCSWGTSVLAWSTATAAPATIGIVPNANGCYGQPNNFDLTYTDVHITGGNYYSDIGLWLGQCQSNPGIRWAWSHQ